MTRPVGTSRNLNTAIFPNQLVQATDSSYNGVNAALFTIPGLYGADKYLTRVVLQTTLTASDMVGGSGGAYWNPSNVPAVQAPFYLFLGQPAPSNLIDLAMIGSVNVGEQLNPLKIPAGTDITGLWLGVLAGSGWKCEATLCFVDRYGT